MTKNIHQSLGSRRESVELTTLRKLLFDSPPPPGDQWHPWGSLITPGERWWLHWRFLIARLWRVACLLEGWVPHGNKWTVTLFYPLLPPQCLLTRRTSHLESTHSDSVTIHGHHFLKDKCLQKVPFILLSELHCLLPSRDPEVEE